MERHGHKSRNDEKVYEETTNEAYDVPVEAADQPVHLFSVLTLGE